MVQIKLFFAFILAAAAAAIAPAVALPVPVENHVLPTVPKPAKHTDSMEPPVGPPPPISEDEYQKRLHQSRFVPTVPYPSDS